MYQTIYMGAIKQSLALRGLAKRGATRSQTFLPG